VERWIRHPISSFRHWWLKRWLDREMHRDLMRHENEQLLYGVSKTKCPHGEPHRIELIEGGPRGIAPAPGESPSGAP